MPLPQALLNTLRITALSLGSILTLLGVGLGIHEGWFLSHSDVTSGVILSIQHKQGKDYPRVMFSSKKSRQYETNTTKAVTGLHAGQSVSVRYNVSNPNDAKVDFGTPFWFFAMLLAGVGVLITYGGLYLDHMRKQ